MNGFESFAARLQAQLDQRMDEITSQGVELIFLEEAYKDDMSCEFNHDNTHCSTEVTHAAIACEDRVMVCRVAAEFLVNKLGRDWGRCRGCQRRPAECWRVVPV